MANQYVREQLTQVVGNMGQEEEVGRCGEGGWSWNEGHDFLGWGMRLINM